jgi:hypothetical protein
MSNLGRTSQQACPVLDTGKDEPACRQAGEIPRSEGLMGVFQQLVSESLYLLYPVRVRVIWRTQFQVNG